MLSRRRLQDGESESSQPFSSACSSRSTKPFLLVLFVVTHFLFNSGTCVYFIRLFFLLDARVFTTIFVKADYYCPNVVPPSGTNNYNAVSANEYVGNECIFSGLGDPSRTSLMVYVPHMAIDAMSTLSGNSVIEIYGATFYDCANIAVNGFSASFPGYDEATIESAKFSFILANSVIRHRAYGVFFTAVAFSDRFPPGSNITIFNNTFYLRLKDNFNDVSPDSLEKMFTFLWFQLESGLRDRSVLSIQQNMFNLDVLTDGGYAFDLSSYKALINARHEYAESTGTPNDRGEWSVNGDQFVRYAPILTFAIEKLLVSRSSRILIISNRIEYFAALKINDAEAVVLCADLLYFQTPVTLEGGSSIIFHQNLALLVTTTAALVHEQSDLSATFINFVLDVIVSSRSSIEITQNIVEQHSSASSHFDSSANDDRLSHPQIIRAHSILFGKNFLLSDVSLLLVALNQFKSTLVAEIVPDSEAAASGGVVFSAVHHQLHLEVANHSLYHVHGTTGQLVFVLLPAPRTLSTVFFVDFDDGTVIRNHSEVIVGCVNPSHHPDPNVRLERPIRRNYSDAYEESLSSPAQASLWNGPVIGTNASRYELALREEEEGGLNTDPTVVLRNDSFLGKRYDHSSFGSAPRTDRCYSNFVLLHAKQQDEETTAIHLMCFMCVWNRAFVIAGSSAFTISNNGVSIRSTVPEPQSFLFFSMVTIAGYGDLSSAHNQLFEGQMVITGALDAVPTSSINADSNLDHKDEHAGKQLSEAVEQRNPSAIIVTDNEITREWTNAAGFGQSLLTLISTFGVWIMQNSSVLIRNNYMSLLAHPPSFFFQPNASQLIERNKSKDVVKLSSNPKSPNYDPFLIYKNRSFGVSPILSFDNSFIANPNMTLKFMGNRYAYFNHPTTFSSPENPLQLLPFSGYKLPGSNEQATNLIPPNFHFTILSYIDEALRRGDLYDEEGMPTTFVPRMGPPLHRAINWDTKNERKEPVQDVWHQRNLTREEGNAGIAVIIKNQTTIHRNPSNPPSSQEGNITEEPIPWSHDWSIKMCGSRTNSVPVSRLEAVRGLGGLVNFEGLPINPTRGEAYVEQHGVGLKFVHCDTVPSKQTLSPTLYVSSSSTCRTEPPTLSASFSPSDHLRRASKSPTTSLTPAIPARVALRDPEGSPGLRDLQGTTSDVIGGVIASVGTALSGGTSVQVTIGNALLRMSTCATPTANDGNDNYDDSLPVLIHPLRFSIMASEAFHQERGAVVGNLAIAAASVTFVRLAVVNVVGRFLTTGEDASVILGWPSAVVLPFVALAEGTASSATTLLRALANAGKEHAIVAVGNETTMTIDESTEAGPLLLTATTALTAVLGILGLSVLLGVGAWWAYCIFAVLPRSELAFTRQDHVGGRLAWAFSPLYAYEYRANIKPPHQARHEGNDKEERAAEATTCTRSTNSGAHPFPREDSEENECNDRKLEDLTDDNENSHNGLGASFVSLMGITIANKSSTCSTRARSTSAEAETHESHSPPPLTAAEHAARAEAVMTVMERHGHILGDRVYLWVELLCYAAVVVIGVSEGLGDDAEQCRARITIAAVAALAQVALNALSTIPLDLCVQSVLGLVTAALALMAVVRVFAEGSVGAGLAEAMDVVSSIGNLLGLAALALEVVVVGLRLFRARRQRQARALVWLRNYSSGSSLPTSRVRSQCDDSVAFDDVEELSFIDNKDQSGTKKSKKGRATTATTSKAFQINVDFGDDLDLFLLDVEEEAMRVDELEISLDEDTAGYMPVEALREPEIDLD